MSWRGLVLLYLLQSTLAGKMRCTFNQSDNKCSAAQCCWLSAPFLRCCQEWRNVTYPTISCIMLQCNLSRSLVNPSIQDRLRLRHVPTHQTTVLSQNRIWKEFSARPFGCWQERPFNAHTDQVVKPVIVQTSTASYTPQPRLV